MKIMRYAFILLAMAVLAQAPSVSAAAEWTVDAVRKTSVGTSAVQISSAVGDCQILTLKTVGNPGVLYVAPNTTPSTTGFALGATDSVTFSGLDGTLTRRFIGLTGSDWYAQGATTGNSISLICQRPE